MISITQDMNIQTSILPYFTLICLHMWLHQIHDMIIHERERGKDKKGKKEKGEKKRGTQKINNNGGWDDHKPEDMTS